MVGPGLRKYSQENGFKLDEGVAYGVFGGYMVTLSEGADMKKVAFSGGVTDEAAEKLITAFDESFKKQYRITSVQVLRESVVFTFFDTVGTMKKIKAAMEILPGMLFEAGVLGDGFCTACGNAIESGQGANIAIINGIVHRIHSACASSQLQRVEMEKDAHKSAEKNLGRGIVGAVLGAAIGGLVWAGAYYAGWFIALIGVLIAFLAKKGYELLGGKICKAKVAVVLFATIFGAIFGQIVGDFAVIAMEIQGTEYLLSDIPFIYIFTLAENSELLTATLGDLGLGLVFALLGGYGIMRNTKDENDTATFVSKILE